MKQTNALHPFFNTNANTPVLRRAPRSLGYALIGQLTQKLFHRQMCSKPTPYFFFLPVILVLVDLERYFYIISAGKRSGVDCQVCHFGNLEAVSVNPHHEVKGSLHTSETDNC